jgi:hypothetical protein
MVCAHGGKYLIECKLFANRLKYMTAGKELTMVREKSRRGHTVQRGRKISQRFHSKKEEESSRAARDEPWASTSSSRACWNGTCHVHVLHLIACGTCHVHVQISDLINQAVHSAAVKVESAI